MKFIDMSQPINKLAAWSFGVLGSCMVATVIYGSFQPPVKAAEETLFKADSIDVKARDLTDRGGGIYLDIKTDDVHLKAENRNPKAGEIYFNKIDLCGVPADHWLKNYSHPDSLESIYKEVLGES